MHKRRFFRFANRGGLIFGCIGLMILQPLRLNSRQIFRYKLFLKKSAKRSDKTLRFTWFNVFPHIPITRKVEGSRMGKGKGKLAGWSSELPAGILILEFKNLRSGRAIYFCKQIMHKLPAKSKIIFRSKVRTSLLLSSSTKISYDVIW